MVNPVVHVLRVGPKPPSSMRFLAKETVAALNLQRKKATINYIVANNFKMRINAVILG